MPVFLARITTQLALPENQVGQVGQWMRARKTGMDLAKIRDILSMGFKEYMVHMTCISEGGDRA